MTHSIRWLVLAGAAMLALYLGQSIDISTDGRQLAGIESLKTLSNHNDLNVLFVLVDTLRADRLHSYGYERKTSPAIDALADDGIRFANHRSQSSWTKASMASLWTGLYPVRTQVHLYQHALPDAALMPAEILRDSGFRTFGIWRNGWVAPNFGFHQGFESYHNPRVSRIPNEVRQEKPTLQVVGTDVDIIDSTLTLLRSYQNERWFLYLHMMDLHQYTYDDESAIFGTSYSDAYDNSIRRTDRLIGWIIQELVSLGLRDRTLVVIASDHGEAFGEHGHEGHAKDLYGEVTTTPWILSLPFRLKTGLVIDTETENVDIWPTVLDLLGLPDLLEPDGRSRAREIRAAARGRGTEGPSETHFAQLDRSWGRVGHASRPLVSVTKNRYRLIQPIDGFGEGEFSGGELFNLENDPLESTNLIADEPLRASELHKELAAYLDSAPPQWQPRSVEIDDMDLRQLRALGYAIE